MNSRNRDAPSFLNKYLRKDANPKRPFEFQTKTEDKHDASGILKKAERKIIEQNFQSQGDQSVTKNMILPNYEPSKCSSGRNGIVQKKIFFSL